MGPHRVPHARGGAGLAGAVAAAQAGGAAARRTRQRCRLQPVSRVHPGARPARLAEPRRRHPCLPALHLQPACGRIRPARRHPWHRHAGGGCRVAAPLGTRRHHRHADRTAQSPRLPHRACAPHRTPRPRRRAQHPALRQPRPLPRVERPARPGGRRLGAGGGRRPAGQHAAPHRPDRPAGRRRLRHVAQRRRPHDGRRACRDPEPVRSRRRHHPAGAGRSWHRHLHRHRRPQPRQLRDGGDAGPPRRPRHAGGEGRRPRPGGCNHSTRLRRFGRRPTCPRTCSTT